MLILGIETSCDETAASIVEKNKVLSNIVSSQVNIHKKFGGIVPEVASRDHIKKISFVVNEALRESNIGLANIDGIAVCYGPGLVGSLLVGLEFAKSLSLANKIKLIGINHIEAHLTSIFLDNKRDFFPYIGLIVSGGHTSLYLVKDFMDYTFIGHTVDDASGEAFDKIANFFNLGYPGGVLIDKFSQKGRPDFFRFPRALDKRDNFNFSFSGLKTSVVNYIKKNGMPRTKKELYDVLASFQEAIVDSLVKKTINAARKLKVKNIVLGGGVSCNNRLREKFLNDRNELNVFFPEKKYCTDNAAMIAQLGYRYLEANKKSDLTLNAVPNLKI